MDLPAATLGIDIAKMKFDVCLIKPNGKAKHKVFQNTRHGFEQLACWLASHQVPDSRACLEATGTYGEPLALFLFEAGFTVSLVNPAAVRAKALAGLSRTKTDKVDAELIAVFVWRRSRKRGSHPRLNCASCKLLCDGSNRLRCAWQRKTVSQAASRPKPSSTLWNSTSLTSSSRSNRPKR